MIRLRMSIGMYVKKNNDDLEEEDLLDYTDEKKDLWKWYIIR